MIFAEPTMHGVFIEVGNALPEMGRRS